MPATLDNPVRKRAIGYVRVSAKGGRSGPEYHTREEQEKSIRGACEGKGFDLIGILTDENRSGKSRNRPRFQEAMNLVLSGEADAIVVWKVSRFSRNWSEAAVDIETLMENGKDLISGSESFDTSTTEGMLLLRIILLVATWELEVLGEGWTRIKNKVVEERGVTLGHAGLGYDSVGGLLVPNEDASFVLEMFQARDRGATRGQLTKLLNDRKPREKSKWGTRDVDRILGRRAYIGEAHWQDIVVPDAHPAIVPRELFDRVQVKMVEDEVERPERNEDKREFPLSSFMRCSNCKGPMGGSVDTGAHGVKRPNYKCSRRGVGCDKPQSISAIAAEASALATIDAVMQPGSAWVAQASESGDRMAALQSELDEANEQMEQLRGARKALGAGWVPAMEQLQAEIDTFNRQLGAERKQAGLPALVQNWSELPRSDWWKALRGAAERIEVLPFVRGGRPADRLVVFWHGEERQLVSEAQ